MKVLKILWLMLKDFGGFFISTLLKPLLIILFVVIGLWAVSIPSVWVVDNVYPNIPVVRNFINIESLKEFDYNENFKNMLKPNIGNFLAYAFIGFFTFMLLIAPWVIIAFISLIAIAIIIILIAFIIGLPSAIKDLWVHYSNKV